MGVSASVLPASPGMCFLMLVVSTWPCLCLLQPVFPFPSSIASLLCMEVSLVQGTEGCDLLSAEMHAYFKLLSEDLQKILLLALR